MFFFENKSNDFSGINELDVMTLSLKGLWAVKGMEIGRNTTEKQ